ncbi:MAG: substrate-binding domain-containing protein [Syntrophobacteraceae bacterium]
MTKQLVICNLKAARKTKGLSQSELAEQVGVKRQAIYDMESGRYVPNTQVALLLAKVLSCRVEDLFSIVLSLGDRAVTLVEEIGPSGPRVSLVKVRDRLIAYPLDDKWISSEGFQSADGLLQDDCRCVRLLLSEEALGKKALLLGCDPAFAILSSHVSRSLGDERLQCRFSQSTGALRALSSGYAHLAGTHLHNTSDTESNLDLARATLGEMKAKVIAFSSFEEGLMVGPGNPHGIKAIGDLAGGVRFANREPGAALRVLLDDHLNRLGISPETIDGYDRMVRSHNEGAKMVSFGLIDAALGLRAVAMSHGLGFVSLAMVRCDLVIPHDLMEHSAVKIILELLQTRGLREELSALPGYDSSRMGTVIGET